MTEPTTARLRRPLFRYPLKATAILLVVYCGGRATIAVARWWAVHRWGLAPEPLRTSDDAVTTTFGAAALLYSFSRTWRYHPSLKPPYAEWLSTTPWRRGRPLPVGPPYLVWEDAVPPAVVFCLCPTPVVPVAVATAAYLAVALRITHRGRDGAWLAYAGANGAAAGLLAVPHPAAVWAIVVALLVATDAAVRRSLADLPWVTPVAAAARAAKAKREQSKWPVAPVEPPRPIPAVHGWLIAASAAWVVFCLVAANAGHGRDERFDTDALVAGGAALAATVRWATYCGEYQPPISTWGRLRTGRLVLPGYDRAVVAPLAVLALSALPFALDAADLPLPVVAAVPTFAVVAIVLNAGPTLRNWQLTGHHRIVARRPQIRVAGKSAA